MSWKYDKQVDAVYIRLREGVKRAFGQQLDDARYIDFGEDNKPIGIELLGVSQGVDTRGLPQREEVERLLTEHNIKIFAWSSNRAISTRFQT
jgi:uncharacterized protein YuzE